MVVETNTDSSLPETLKNKLRERNYNGCVITELHSTKIKEVKINSMKDLIKDKMYFPERTKYGINSQMGKAMQQLTIYSFDFPNKHDDMPDSLAIFAEQVILGEAIPQKAVAVRRRF